jgi:hypothetical protein
MNLTEIKITILQTSNEPVVNFVVTQSYPGEAATFTLPQHVIDAFKEYALCARGHVNNK